MIDNLIKELEASCWIGEGFEEGEKFLFFRLLTNLFLIFIALLILAISPICILLSLMGRTLGYINRKFKKMETNND